MDPYIGPRPFGRNHEDKALFFGRRYESEQIVARILGNQLVLIYGASGVGKTSILNAQVIPILEENGSHVFPVVRVDDWSLDHSSVYSNVYVFNVLRSLSPDTDPKILMNMSFSEFLNDYFRSQDREQMVFSHVIILDRFEALFKELIERQSYHREEFFRQITEALDKYSDLSVVFVFREEYLTQLDPYIRILPKRKSCFRLESLRREAAYQAITGPLKDIDLEIETEINKIIHTLLVKSLKGNSDGNIVRHIEGEFVEPIYLQVVCQRWWQERVERRGKGRVSDLNIDDINIALKDFYKESIADTVKQTSISEKEIRDWFQKQLITSWGTRGIVHRDQNSTGGLDNKAVDILENKYIIRRGSRAGSLWYELTHDRLIQPIIDSNRSWESLNKNKGFKRYFSFGKHP